MPKLNDTSLLKEKIRYLKGQVISLRAEIEVEQNASNIDKILDKEKYDKLCKTTIQIARDFLRYKEAHPDKDESDTDDGDDDYVDSSEEDPDDRHEDDDSDEEPDYDGPPVSPEERKEVRYMFGI